MRQVSFLSVSDCFISSSKHKWHLQRSFHQAMKYLHPNRDILILNGGVFFTFLFFSFSKTCILQKGETTRQCRVVFVHQDCPRRPPATRCWRGQAATSTQWTRRRTQTTTSCRSSDPMASWPGTRPRGGRQGMMLCFGGLFIFWRSNPLPLKTAGIYGMVQIVPVEVV